MVRTAIEAKLSFQMVSLMARVVKNNLLYVGEKVTDLHRHFIDHLELPSKQGKGELRRIPDVFDCWFESGSMPYAQARFCCSLSQQCFVFCKSNLPDGCVAMLQSVCEPESATHSTWTHVSELHAGALPVRKQRALRGKLPSRLCR